MADEKEIVDISSSEEEEDDDEEYELEETEDEDQSLSGDDSEWSEDSATESDVDHDDVDDDDDDESGDDDDESCDDDDDDDSLANKVIRLLKGGRDLKALKVKECKAYLRKHGLRLAGTKPVCIQRIIEHSRIKDGGGEAVYPRSSFVVNCRGDVCKGDTVLFTQKVYQKFDKVRRNGKLLGTRSVAGKVVKESYGAAKQQHTFTIEVLWSEGIQKLPPLHPLLVKGRILYRLSTFRQPWANGDERLKVLSEKHKRGAAARQVRAMRKARKMQSANNIERGEGHQKHGRDKKPCEIRKTTKPEKKKQGKENENPSHCVRQETAGIHSYSNPVQSPPNGHKNPTERRNMNKPSHSYAPHSYAPRPYAPRPYAPRSHVPPSYAPSNIPHSYAPSNVPRSHGPCPNAPRSYAYPTQNRYVSQNQLFQRPPPFYNRGFTSHAMARAFFDPRANTSAVPVSNQRRSYGNHYTHRANPNPSYMYRVRDLDHFSEMTISQRPEGDTYRWRNNSLSSNH